MRTRFLILLNVLNVIECNRFKEFIEIYQNNLSFVDTILS